MEYNKSEIMKNAWNYFKNGKCSTFSQALKLSWEDAKTETVTANELRTGDTVKIEYGDYNNLVKCTVTEVSKELFLGKFLVVNAVVGEISVEFCPEPSEPIKRFKAMAA